MKFEDAVAPAEKFFNGNANHQNSAKTHDQLFHGASAVNRELIK